MPKKINPLLLLLSLLLVIFLSWGCDSGEPIAIGFSGSLTGRFAELGIDGRNALILAVEEINDRGGVNGRPLKVLVRDDGHEPVKAIKADRELIDKKVVAIIGHMTSAMSTAAIPQINREKILMISPTTSTSEIDGKDDWFFRVMASNSISANFLGEYAAKNLKLRKMALLYDLANKAYSETWASHFKSSFEANQGTIAMFQTFNSNLEKNHSALAKNIISMKPDGVLIVAGAFDTAIIAQQLRKQSPKVPIIGSGWAATQDLLQYGGSAVNGMIFSQSNRKSGNTLSYQSFRNKYKNRFNREPGFASSMAYDAAQVLFYALSSQKKGETLKETILKKRKFTGIQGEFEIDPYGDCIRPNFLSKVVNGKFITKE